MRWGWGIGDGVGRRGHGREMTCSGMRREGLLRLLGRGLVKIVVVVRVVTGMGRGVIWMMWRVHRGKRV